MDVFFNRQSAYLWVQTVLLFSLTCSFIRMRHFTFRYINDVLSLNISRFGDFVDGIYPIELEMKDTTYTTYVCFTQWREVKNKTLRQKRWFNFPIANFPFICNNIPAAPAYGVYISQLIQYSKVLRSPPWLDWLLWNICVTNDHGYVPLDVTTPGHFLIHDWSPGL